MTDAATHGDDHADAPEVPVTGEIRLGQFLKYASLVDSGADARAIITDGDVRVNGETETRRGRRLAGGDLVEVQTADGTIAARVAVDDEAPRD